jgi:hypothetical protein
VARAALPTTCRRSCAGPCVVPSRRPWSNTERCPAAAADVTARCRRSAPYRTSRALARCLGLCR